MVNESALPDGRLHPAVRGFDASLLEAFLKGETDRRAGALPALSMFSNAGVGDYGYRLAGFSFHAHAELLPRRLEICKLNHPRSAMVPGDLRETMPAFLAAYKEHAKGRRPALLTGCSPCQGLSSASAWARVGEKSVSKDPRNRLPFLIAEAAREIRPRVVVVENVAAIMTTNVADPETGEIGPIADLLAKRLSDYILFPATLQFADFGVPQRRRRAIFTFIRKGESCLRRLEEAKTVPYPSKTHDVSERFGRLPWVTARGFLGPPRFAPLDSKDEESAKHAADPLHYVPHYDAERYDLVRLIPPFSGKSAYETDACPHCGAMPQPPGMAQCIACEKPLHSRPVVKRNGSYRLITGHHTSYKRMPPDLPASTVTTATGHLGSDTKIHPWENRLLSPRECASLQTIPVNFRWQSKNVKPFNETLRATIGEAIPPWFTYLHGLVLNNLLNGARVAPLLLRADDMDVEPREVGAGESRKALRRKRLSRSSSRANRAKEKAAHGAPPAQV